MKKQQVKSLNTKLAFLRAAEALFAEKGYDETSVQEIVNSAGYSIGAFYGHFASKQDIAAQIWSDIMIGNMSETTEKGASINDEDQFISFLIDNANSIHKNKAVNVINSRIVLPKEVEEESGRYAMRYLTMIRDAIKRFNPAISEENAWDHASVIHCLIMNYSQSRFHTLMSITENGVRSVVRKLIDDAM